MKIVIEPREHIWPEVTTSQLREIRESGADEVVVATTREEMLDAVRDADALVGGMDPEVFEYAGQLQWVQALASGVDVMLFDEFIDSDIILTSEKGLVGPHLADHTFALLLGLTRSIVWAARQRSWDNRLPMRRANRELTGMTMGIIGLGGTGTEVARRAAAFGMRSIAVDPDVTERPPFVDALGPPERLIETARQSNVLTVCCPFTPATRHMVDETVLNALPAHSYVINVTRGEIIDQDALISAVESGHLAGVGLDVTPQEPLPEDSPLWSFDNVVITPHTAGASQFRSQRVHQRLCDNIRHIINNNALEGVIDKRKGY